MGRAVDVRAERAALGRKLAAVSQGKYLESAAVGQYRAVPSGEPVQTSGHAQGLQAGTQIQMIGIAQNDLRSDVAFQVPVIYTLDRTDSPHRHEDRCLYRPVVCLNPASAGIGLRICLKQRESHQVIPSRTLSHPYSLP